VLLLRPISGKSRNFNNQIREVKKVSKVLIAEYDPGLGPMVRAKMRPILGPEDIILVEDLTEAINADKTDVKVAIVGHLASRNGVMAEQALIDVLKRELPEIVVISCTCREMQNTDFTIKRPDGYLKIEEVVKKALSPKEA